MIESQILSPEQEFIQKTFPDLTEELQARIKELAEQDSLNYLEAYNKISEEDAEDDAKDRELHR